MNEALQQLQTEGYVILPGLLSAPEVEEVSCALAPLLTRQPWGQGEFFGSRTRRLHNILAKTRVTDCLVGHPTVVELVRTVLGHPQVSIVNAIEIHPGETAQPFHQDDVLFPIARQIALLSRSWALQDGDVIYTGTPEGVGPLVPGDDIALDAPHLGHFRWTCT